MTRVSPLHSRHERLGGRFVDFGGWDMPVQYDSVIAEHKAVREAVGVFDVSHLGRLAVSGPGATEALRALLCNDVNDYAPGRTHYTMMLNDDGGIVDDIVVWRWDDSDYWLMPNAANSETVQERLQEAGAGVTVTDLRPETVMLAVQGPSAPHVIESVLGASPRRFRTLKAAGVRLAGTGYTGEKGGEICLEADEAGRAFDAMLEAGAVPCGLGARDTLRLEAGLPLWGSDIDTTTTPLEAGLGFAIKWDHDFVGKPALERQAEAGVGRLLSGLVMADRGIPRHGHPVKTPTGDGVVTSGNMSPMLGMGVALAYLQPPVEPETSVEVEIRSRWVSAVTASPPFHR